MILPDIRAGALHAGRRVEAFPDLKSKRTVTSATLITREVNCGGIIRLTFTA
jgi:hypothetical protein